MRNLLGKKRATIIVEQESYEVELPIASLEREHIENTPVEEIVHKYIAVVEKEARAEQLAQFHKGYSRRWQY